MFTVGLGQDARNTLLTAAVRAPSMHNTQPWRFQVGTSTVQVYRDLDRWLRADDPRKSALHISLGAVVLNLRVAAAEIGRLAHVTLLPDPDDADHVATVSLAAGLGVDAELAALFPFLARRRTSRRPFADRWIPDRAVRDLEHAATLDGGHLRVIRDPSRVRRLLGLAAEGATNELFDLDRLRERAHWVGGERSEDGIPTSSLGPHPTGHPGVVRDLAVRRADRERPAEAFERRPALAVLSVRRDDPVGWLVAGQALERVLLTAARWGLSASFMNQALTSEQMWWFGHDPDHGAEHPQMVLRLGYAELPEPTPRRALQEFEAPGSW